MIISILLILLVAVVIYFIIQRMLPVDLQIKNILYIILAVLTIIAILYQASPLFPSDLP